MQINYARYAERLITTARAFDILIAGSYLRKRIIKTRTFPPQKFIRRVERRKIIHIYRRMKEATRQRHRPRFLFIFSKILFPRQSKNLTTKNKKNKNKLLQPSRINIPYTYTNAIHLSRSTYVQYSISKGHELMHESTPYTCFSS